jgi:peptidoglycan hydrolase-like protein with peptidoglycan-binding domain
LEGILLKKGKKTVACAIAAAVSVSAFSGLIGMTKLGPLGVEVVSAATGTTTSTPASKPATTTKTTTTTTSKAAANVAGTLKLGSKGSDVKNLQALLNSNGYKLTVDGIFGQKTLAAVKGFQKAKGLAVNGIVDAKTLTALKPVVKVEKTNIKLGKAEYAAHGTKCFTVAVVAMAGDKIASALLDDYQVSDATTYKAVPNSDKDFGANFAIGKVLASKMENAATYSANMAKSGGATITIDKNLAAVQDFAKGKTIAELEAIIAKNTGVDPKVDVVTGATLTDTNGYLSAIVAAAKEAEKNSPVQIDASQVSSLKLNKAEYAAHGTKCFTLATTVVVGDKIVAAIIDDYQVGASTTNIGVPNSDKDFGKGIITAGNVLYSKKLNADAYSKNMMERGGATLSVQANFGAVEQFAVGKTISQLEAAIKANPADPKVDAVAGATLTDTNGYLSAILTAAKGTTSSVTVVPSKIAKIGLGHITSIKGSKDLVAGSGALGQVDTTIAAVGFDKDGKVSAITIDNAQTKIQFNDDLTLKSDLKAEQKTKVELKEGYGMIKASAIKKEWYQQAEALGQWMIGKTVDQILGMKTVAKDASHPAVPAEPDVISSVSITVGEIQQAVKEAYDNSVAVKPGSTKLGLGHEIKISSSKGLGTNNGTQVLPLAQVDTSLTVAAFDKDGKVTGAIIDNAQTKINFSADGKVTNDKNAEIKTKNELKEAYGMVKASSIKKEWFEQAKAFANWIVAKTAEQVMGMKTVAKDASHPAVPAEPDVVASVTITVDGIQNTLSEAYKNAK